MREVLESVHALHRITHQKKLSNCRRCYSPCGRCHSERKVEGRICALQLLWKSITSNSLASHQPKFRDLSCKICLLRIIPLPTILCHLFPFLWSNQIQSLQEELVVSVHKHSKKYVEKWVLVTGSMVSLMGN